MKDYTIFNIGHATHIAMTYKDILKLDWVEDLRLLKFWFDSALIDSIKPCMARVILSANGACT